jgi:hypothetical protein
MTTTRGGVSSSPRAYSSDLYADAAEPSHSSEMNTKRSKTTYLSKSSECTSTDPNKHLAFTNFPPHKSSPLLPPSNPELSKFKATLVLFFIAS